MLRIAITDNGEPLVDLRSIPALAVDHARTDVQQRLAREAGDRNWVRVGEVMVLAEYQGERLGGQAPPGSSEAGAKRRISGYRAAA